MKKVKRKKIFLFKILREIIMDQNNVQVFYKILNSPPKNLNLPWTWGSRAHWQRRRSHMRRVEWDRAQCRGRRHRPGQGTGRCCRWPAQLSSARWIRTRSLSSVAQLESQDTSHCCSLGSKKRLEIKSNFSQLTLAEDSDGVIKGHGLDVERGEDGLLVSQRGILVGWNFSWEDDAHITEIDVDSSQVRSAQRRTLQRTM